MKTSIKLKQEALAILIATLGKESRLLEDWEGENILPLIRSKDRLTFLQKYTTNYKVRLHKLLQKCFWALPLWKEPNLPATDWQLAELERLIEALSQNLSNESQRNNE